MRIFRLILSSLSAFAASFAVFVRPALADCTSGMLCNISSFSSINDFVAGALRVLVTVSIPVIGFFIVLTGFQFVFAQGKEAALSKAKKNFLYVIIGASLVLGAWVLATIIGSTVSQIAS